MFDVYVSRHGRRLRVDNAMASGTFKECLEFVIAHLPPRECDPNFYIYERETNKQCGYIFVPSGKPTRLLMQDLVSPK